MRLAGAGALSWGWVAAGGAAAHARQNGPSAEAQGRCCHDTVSSEQRHMTTSQQHARQHLAPHGAAGPLIGSYRTLPPSGAQCTCLQAVSHSQGSCTILLRYPRQAPSPARTGPAPQGWCCACLQGLLSAMRLQYTTAGLMQCPAGPLTGSYRTLPPRVPVKSPGVALCFMGEAGLKDAPTFFLRFSASASSRARRGSTYLSPSYSGLNLSKVASLVCGWWGEGHRESVRVSQGVSIVSGRTRQTWCRRSVGVAGWGG